MASEEYVLVVSKKEFLARVGSRALGLIPAAEAPGLASMLFGSIGVYGELRPRSTVEEDETVLQLCTYVVLTHGHPLTMSVFNYRRAKGQGESRLLKKLSVGVGGHVSDPDMSQQRPYFAALQRELQEEVGISRDLLADTVVGFIYDPRDAVGRVHLGVVHQIVVEDKGSVKPEESMGDPKWTPLIKLYEEGRRRRDEGDEKYPEHEGWTQLVLDYLIAAR